MERITSTDLPQADRLESVIATVIAVNNGARRDIEIANQIPGIQGDDRQGRYYRNAAEMLGFIENVQNNATLLPKGEHFLENPAVQNPLLISSILELKVFQKLMPFLEVNSEGVTREEIRVYLESISVTELPAGMINRRLSTIISWLLSIGFLEEIENGLYRLRNNLTEDNPLLSIRDLDQPLLPTTGDLTEFEEIERRTNSASEEVAYFRDEASMERATEAHQRLVNLVAERIRRSNGIPKSNELIDLAVNLDGNFIFEMKSTTADNTRSQIRKGLSQLYEYRYLQNIPTANLVLVIENPLGDANSWMADYLESDREIQLLWDGNDELYASPPTRDILHFLF